MRRSLLPLVILLATLSFACRSSSGTSAYGQSEEKLRVEITVTYLEKILLPPGSTVRAALYDETDELKPAISSNAVAAREGRGVPVNLDLSYPFDQLDDSHEYVVRAEITDAQGRLLFTTDEPVQVIPNQDEPQKIEIVLKRAG